MGGGASTQKSAAKLSGDQVPIQVTSPPASNSNSSNNNNKSSSSESNNGSSDSNSHAADTTGNDVQRLNPADIDSESESESPSSTRHQHATVPASAAKRSSSEEDATGSGKVNFQKLSGLPEPTLELEDADEDEDQPRDSQMPPFPVGATDNKTSSSNCSSNNSNNSDHDNRNNNMNSSSSNDGTAHSSATGCPDHPPHQPGGFHELLREGYEEACLEREKWLKSIAANSAEEDRVPEGTPGPTTTSTPVVLRAPVAKGHSESTQTNSEPDETVGVPSPPTLLPLRDRAPVVAEELKRWTQRMGDRDWPVLHGK